MKYLSAKFEEFLLNQKSSSREAIIDSLLGSKKRSRVEETPGPSKISRMQDSAEITEMKEEPTGRKVHFGDLIIQVQPIARVGLGLPVSKSSHSKKFRAKWPEKFQ